MIRLISILSSIPDWPRLVIYCVPFLTGSGAIPAHLTSHILSAAHYQLIDQRTRLTRTQSVGINCLCVKIGLLVARAQLMRHHFSNPDRFTETGSSSHSLNRAPRKSIHINSRPLPILTLIAALEVKINILNPNFGVPRNYFLFILHDTILRKFHYEQTSIYLQYHSRNNPPHQHLYTKNTSEETF